MRIWLLRPRGLQFAILAAAAMQFAAPSPAGGPHAAPADVTWAPRGAYADREFTSLVSPAGYPCVVAFTALNNGGLGVSTDCGAQFATLLPTNANMVTAKDSNTGYVAAGASGILKTVDGGANWFYANSGLPGIRDARAIVINMVSMDTLYCGLYGHGVFRGGPVQDSLVSWAPMNVGLTDLRVKHLVRVRGGTFLLGATEGGIFRWANGAWSMRDPVVVNRLLIDAADSSRCYAAGPTGVYRSLDYGQSFFPSSTGLPAGVAVNDIVRRTDVPSVLYVGTQGAGVYQSVDYGETWQPFGPALPGDNDVRAVLCVVETEDGLASVFAGTRRDGLFEAEYSTPTVSTTWGRMKATYR